MLVFLATATVCVLAQATDLFISEYLLGYDNNRAIEIFNGTGRPVDLSKYTLKKKSDDSPLLSYTLQLRGLLKHGEVLLIVNPGFFDSSEYAGVLYNGTLNDDSRIVSSDSEGRYGTLSIPNNIIEDFYFSKFSTNDQIILYKNGIELDHFGVGGLTPRVRYSSVKRYIRRFSVKSPVSGKQNPLLNGEWISADANDNSTLGNHIFSKGVIISEIIYSPRNINAIELFNPTQRSIRLEGYSVKRIYGKISTTEIVCDLIGYIHPQQTKVILPSTLKNDLRTSHLNAIYHPTVCGFSLSDFVSLQKDGVELDGVKILESDIKYIRKEYIDQPSPGFQNPITNHQWNKGDCDEISSLGSHNSHSRVYEFEYAYNKAGENEYRAIIIDDPNNLSPTQLNGDDNDDDFDLRATTDILDGQQIVIYPNPTMGDLTVRIPQDLEGEYFIAVYSIRGELVIKERAASGDNRVDVTSSLPGVYVMRITGVNQTLEWKIIKK